MRRAASPVVAQGGFAPAGGQHPMKAPRREPGGCVGPGYSAIVRGARGASSGSVGTVQITYRP